LKRWEWHQVSKGVRPMRKVAESKVLEDALDKANEHKDEFYEHDLVIYEMAESFMSLVHKYGRKRVETLLSGGIPQ
jgi:hypothetical protein